MKKVYCIVKTLPSEIIEWVDVCLEGLTERTGYTILHQMLSRWRYKPTVHLMLLPMKHCVYIGIVFVIMQWFKIRRNLTKVTSCYIEIKVTYKITAGMRNEIAYLLNSTLTYMCSPILPILTNHMCSLQWIQHVEFLYFCYSTPQHQQSNFDIKLCCLNFCSVISCLSLFCIYHT
jgi:hypothetical protein